MATSYKLIQETYLLTYLLLVRQTIELNGKSALFQTLITFFFNTSKYIYTYTKKRVEYIYTYTKKRVEYSFTISLLL